MSDDPTADFLAREKALLGDDADLFASGEIPGVGSGSGEGASANQGMDAFPDLDDAPAKPASPVKSASPVKPDSPMKSPSSGLDNFPALDEPMGSSQVRVTGNVGLGEDEELDKFESAFPDLSSEMPEASSPAPKPVFNALSSTPYGASPYANTVAAPQPRSILPAPEFSNTLPATEEETEPIRQWREKQAEEIKRRNAADQEKRDEMADKAEKAIDQFYEDYNKEKEKNIRENKENEAKFIEKLKDDIARGTTWERITDLIGLENSQSKTIRPSVPGGSDLARMKEILLSLRREGEKAPGAAGF